MNGWQRLFVVFSVLCVGVVVSMVAVEAPSRGIQSVYTCGLLESDVTQARAKQYVKNGIPVDETYLSGVDPMPGHAECFADLQRVADGTMYSHRVREHWGEASELLPWLLGFLALVYAAGWALGWVWRGFFPKKLPAA